jgi:pimeloyl-ACP methyl ester carboxylesterase
MPDSSGFPSADVQFDRDAHVVGSADAVRQLANGPCTDLVVMAHGWNNDAREASELYRQWAASMRTVLDQGRVPALNARKICLVGIVWPSKKFADEDGSLGGAATVASAAEPLDLLAQIDGLRAVFTGPAEQRVLDSAAALVPQLEVRAAARKQFAEALKTLVSPDAVDDEDAGKDLLATDGGELMDRLADPIFIPAPPGDDLGGTAGLDTLGGAAGFGDFLRGPLGAARQLLNFTTFFEMKVRSGAIGARGVAPLLDRIQCTRPDLNVHLVGHSFGARVVAATAKELPADSVATLSLLQGAFSHHGFARNFEPGQNGFFRPVIDNQTVRGPTLITKTGNDKAVGIAYAIASRIANEAAAGLGDAADKFGGIGRNGAQKTPEAVERELLPAGGSYTFQPRALHNLLADAFIRDHSDVKGREVGYAVLSAIGSA